MKRAIARVLILCAIISIVPSRFASAEGPANQGPFSVEGGLVLKDGQPFFWQADTAWRLYRLSEADIRHYLEDRARKGFTVIQMMVFHNRHREQGAARNTPIPNFEGETPFAGLNPVSLNEKYWKHIDFILDSAGKLGLSAAMATMWGQDADSMFPEAMENNYRFGKLLGERYRDRDNLIWIVCGEYEKINDQWQEDNQRISDEQRALLRQIAEGLLAGHGGRQVMTIHPVGTSSDDFHQDAWLAFIMHQTWGHANADVTRIASDYRLTPRKPVLNGEPGYENRSEAPASTAWKCRYEAYWAVFSGAFGHTYGAHRVWQCEGDWRDALDYEGASDMQHLRRLIESRPMRVRVPGQELLASEAGDYVRDATYRAVTRAKDGSYAFVYSTSGLPFEIDFTKLSGARVAAWWYSPRDGRNYDDELKAIAAPFAEFETTGTHTFTPPASGLNEDWVLVLDDAGKGYPPAGPADALSPSPRGSSRFDMLRIHLT